MDDEMDDQLSLGIIEYFGLAKHSRFCGYCNSTSDGCKYGLWAHSLSNQTYQDLIDRNWRRCGKYVYLPINKYICCPMYTIRLDAMNFKISKSQKKVLKRFNNYIKYDIKPKKFNKNTIGQSMSHQSLVADANNISSITESIDQNILKEEMINQKNSSKPKVSAKKPRCDPPQTNQQSTILESTKKSKLKSKKGKFLRRQKLIQKVIKRNGNCTIEEAEKLIKEKSQLKQPKTKTLEDFLYDFRKNDQSKDDSQRNKHTFETFLVDVSSKSGSLKVLNDFEIYKKYQMTIHKDPESEITYQSYKRFLIDSPLNCERIFTRWSDDPDMPRHYGSFHQHYLIDNKLIAVGVIDILPNCLSSVYFFYDPEFSFLNLGVFSALNEIVMVRKLCQKIPDLKYYYMGYYVHSCPKMRYKAKYSPSDLLCSETFRWMPINSCIEKLKNQKYSRFDEDPEAIDLDGGKTINQNDINSIQLFNRQRILSFEMFRIKNQNFKEYQEKIIEFARLVGRKCIRTLLYYVD